MSVQIIIQTEILLFSKDECEQDTSRSDSFSEQKKQALITLTQVVMPLFYPNMVLKQEGLGKPSIIPIPDDV